MTHRTRSLQRTLFAVILCIASVGLAAVLVAQATASPLTSSPASTAKVPPGTFGPRPSPPISLPLQAPRTCATPVDPLPPAGVTNPAAQGILPSIKYPAKDFWAGPVGSDYIQAWAGGISANADAVPNTAAVWLFAYVKNASGCGWDTNELGQYTLSAYKSLTITAVSGTTMTLKTDNGVVVHFDLVARIFE